MANYRTPDKVKCQNCKYCRVDWTPDAPDPKRMGFCTYPAARTDMIKTSAPRVCKSFTVEVNK